VVHQAFTVIRATSLSLLQPPSLRLPGQTLGAVHREGAHALERWRHMEVPKRVCVTVLRTGGRRSGARGGEREMVAAQRVSRVAAKEPSSTEAGGHVGAGGRAMSPIARDGRPFSRWR
jgi:hypothetical protein